MPARPEMTSVSAVAPPVDLGAVAIVGAGPGDAGLLTVRARELLDAADAIVYDARVNPEVLPATVRAGGRAGTAELYFAGRRGERPALSRDERAALVVALARQGKRVVYLTGGDPFVFGDGGEMVQAMHDAELPFEVVPGVTGGIAATGYAGIPVTYRGMAASVTFVTGRDELATGGASRAPLNTMTNWRALAKVGGTIVLHHAARLLPEIVPELLAGGLPGNTPAAAIRAGTRVDQRTVATTLETLPETVAGMGSGTVTVVIGWSVLLRDELGWFETRPLSGRRVVLAAPATERVALAERLRALGAAVLRLPAPRTARLDLAPVRDDLEHIGDYTWLIFTSAEAVELFWELLLTLGRDTRALAGITVCAVGAPTAAALLDRGVTVDVLPDRFDRSALLDVLTERADVATSRVLYLCDEGDDGVLPAGLTRIGADVVARPIFRLVAGGREGKRMQRRVERGRVDLVAFTSPAAVAQYVRIVGDELRNAVPAVAADEATATALRKAGIEVTEEPEPAAPYDFAEAIVRALAAR